MNGFCNIVYGSLSFEYISSTLLPGTNELASPGLFFLIFPDPTTPAPLDVSLGL